MPLRDINLLKQGLQFDTFLSCWKLNDFKGAYLCSFSHTIQQRTEDAGWKMSISALKMYIYFLVDIWSL